MRRLHTHRQFEFCRDFLCCCPVDRVALLPRGISWQKSRTQNQKQRSTFFDFPSPIFHPASAIQNLPPCLLLASVSACMMLSHLPSTFHPELKWWLRFELNVSRAQLAHHDLLWWRQRPSTLQFTGELLLKYHSSAFEWLWIMIHESLISCRICYLLKWYS